MINVDIYWRRFLIGFDFTGVQWSVHVGPITVWWWVD